MIRNYLKIAWRNLSRNLSFSAINVFGITTGITVCGLIFLFVMNEFSVDDFHVKGKHIYRIMRGFDKSKPPAPYLSGPYKKALLNDFRGQILDITRIMPSNDLFTADNRGFNEKKVYFVDSNFFTMFSFPLVEGDPATALKDINSVVLTQTAARKYFGDQDPMGKWMEMDKQRKLKVTGVAKDVPPNSHLYFDIVTPITICEAMPYWNVWLNNNHFEYALLGDHVTPEQVERGFPDFMKKYTSELARKTGYYFYLTLRPLKDIYFEDASTFDTVRHGDKKVVLVFLSIAALILLIACINFMNLSTIRASERSKEVGLRKVMGALRQSLAAQFLGESILLTLLSCALSVGLLQLLMPVYSDFLGYSLHVPYGSWWFYAFLGGVIVVVGLLAGSYPALILSAFSPIEALKGKLKRGKGGALFRQVLVVVQFSISVFLITGTIIINKQMHFVKQASLGYDQEQALIVPVDNDDIGSHLIRFKKDLQKTPGVASVSVMSGEPGGFFDDHVFQVEGRGDKVWQSRTEFADFEYVKTLGLKVIAGRDFSPQYPTDSMLSVLLNRKAAEDLGFTPQQAVGKWILNTSRDNQRRRIVGVVENFNFASLKENIEPLVISTSEDYRVVVVRLKAGNLPASIDQVKKAYEVAAPSYPFEYTFLDQKFEELYTRDIRQQNLLSVFSGLAIVIACLGLFGLASFTAAKRTKEIGVRKVLGSSVKNIVLLLSRDLLRPVLLATLLAIPLAYGVMQNWLQHFAYRTALSWWVFVLAAVITVMIALITVSLKAVKAALVNPATSLRSE
jgi:putative ABC transport system permease protein